MFSLTIAEHVATLTLDRPPGNAISRGWLLRVDGILDELASRTDWKVLHLRSQHNVFCAGADLNEMRERMDVPDGPDRTYAYVGAMQRLYARIETLPQVTLAEIGGAAMGGGLELALACDLRIAASEAKLGLPEVRLGLIPGGGGTQRLTRLVGRGLANRLILGAEAVDGVTAERLGLGQWGCARAESAERAPESVGPIAALPAAALAAAKRCVASAATPGRGGYGDELELTRALQTDAETRQRVGAFIAGARV